jgi:phospholipid-translocating ATPase
MFTILAEFPFDSTRKRMSLIVQTERGQKFLLCKGADSIVLPRCAFINSKEKDIKILTEKHLEEFAMEGLRTLVMGQRQISDREYIDFSQKFDALKKTGSDPLKETKINNLFDDME